jgi:hypothetical protein
VKHAAANETEIREFHKALDEISQRLRSGELSTPPKYSEVFERGLILVRRVSSIDLQLAKEILRNMVESSVVLLLSSSPERGVVTVKIDASTSIP